MISFRNTIENVIVEFIELHVEVDSIVDNNINKTIDSLNTNKAIIFLKYINRKKYFSLLWLMYYTYYIANYYVRLSHLAE